MRISSHLAPKHSIKQPQWHDDIGFEPHWTTDQQCKYLDHLRTEPSWRYQRHTFSEELMTVLDDFAEFDEEYNFPYPSPAWAYLWKRRHHELDGTSTHAESEFEYVLLIKLYDDGVDYHELPLAAWGFEYLIQHLPYRDAGYPLHELMNTLDTYQRIAKLRALIAD